MADALSRYAAGDVPPEPHGTMYDTEQTGNSTRVCAAVIPPERCRSCRRQHIAFSAEGEMPAIADRRRTEMERPSRPEAEPTGEESICHLQKLVRNASRYATIWLESTVRGSQYGQKEPIWLQQRQAGCFASGSTDPMHSDKQPLIFIPQVSRTVPVHRMHLGPEAGHFGRTKTLARLRARYVWERWPVLW